MSDIPAVILAGGQARRMGGGDKCLLELGEQPVLSHIIGRLKGQAGRIALNANGNPARFARYGLPVVADEIGGFAGPLAGVLAAMRWAHATGAEHVVTVAGDTPFFPVDLVKRLVEAAHSENRPIALAASLDAQNVVRRQPVFGLWPVGLEGDLETALKDGMRKVVAWTDRHGAAAAHFKASPYDPFFNINTADDLDTALGMLPEVDR